MKRDEVSLGIDLGGTNARAAVVDQDGHVLGQEKHRLLSREPPQVAEAVVRAAKTACGAAGMPLRGAKGMGLRGARLVARGPRRLPPPPPPPRPPRPPPHHPP